MNTNTPPPDTATREGNTIAVVIYTEPIPQPRQRHSVNRRSGFVRNYTPAKHPVNAMKKRIRDAVASVIDAPWLGPVAITVIFQFPRPKNRIWKTKPMPEYRHVCKPDIDNLAKAVMDALTGVLFADDGQIFSAILEKNVSPGNTGGFDGLCENPDHTLFPQIRIFAYLLTVAD